MKQEQNTSAQDLEIEMKPLNDDIDSTFHQQHEHSFHMLNNLRDELDEKNTLIQSLKQNEEVYLTEINRLKNELNQAFETSQTQTIHNLISLETSSNLITQDSLFDTTNDSICKEQKILTPLKETRFESIQAELEAKEAEIDKLKLELKDYANLREEIENLTHPSFIQLAKELKEHFNEVTFFLLLRIKLHQEILHLNWLL